MNRVKVEDDVVIERNVDEDGLSVTDKNEPDMKVPTNNRIKHNFTTIKKINVDDAVQIDDNLMEDKNERQ